MPDTGYIPIPRPVKKRKIEYFFDSFKHFLTSNVVSISPLKIVLFMVVYGLVFFAGGAYFLQKGALAGFMRSSAFESLVSTINKSVDECRQNSLDQSSQLEKCQQNLRNQAETASYDKVRIADATNILLGLQNYNFDKGALPETLQVLADKSYYSGNLIDPELGKFYYYKKIDSENYVLCIYLSTGIWGSNRNKCPTKEYYLDDKNTTSTAETGK